MIVITREPKEYIGRYSAVAEAVKRLLERADCDKLSVVARTDGLTILGLTDALDEARETLSRYRQYDCVSADDRIKLTLSQRLDPAVTYCPNCGYDRTAIRIVETYSGMYDGQLPRTRILDTVSRVTQVSCEACRSMLSLPVYKKPRR